MVPNQCDLCPSEQICPVTAVTTLLEAQLVPKTFWSLAVCEEKVSGANISPGCQYQPRLPCRGAEETGSVDKDSEWQKPEKQAKVQS